MRTDSTSVFNPGHPIDGWTKIEARNEFQEQNRRPRGPGKIPQRSGDCKEPGNLERIRGKEPKWENFKGRRALESGE